MSYEHEPREGVDYLVDLYAVSGVELGAAPEDIKHAINERSMQYHPDRLQGLAPEFQSKGERITALLNRARAILLQPESKAEYDQMLAEWEGPISTTGEAVVTADWFEKAKVRGMSPDEIEAGMSHTVEQIHQLSGYNPGLLEFLEKQIADAGEHVPAELRAQYDRALHDKDSILSVEETERARLIGLNNSNEPTVASLDYAETVKSAIEQARTEHIAVEERRALGGIATRLALLAGEPQPSSELAAHTTQAVLPPFFEAQAAKVQSIAEERATIAEQRMVNLQPDYPEPELQTERKNKLALGLKKGDECRWIGFAFDHERDHAEGTDIPDEVRSALEAGRYAEVIKSDYAVMIISWLDGIDPHDLVGVAIGKYTDQYDT